MQIFKIGDQVAVLHDTLKGRVVEVSSTAITIEDSDGFLRQYAPGKLALQASNADYKIVRDIPIKDLPVDQHKMKKAVEKKTAAVAVSEIDLHIEELREVHAHLSNFEIVQIQMTACRAFIKKSIAQNLKKVVIIHGKGTGVLKSEIWHYLERLSNEGIKLDYHDASYQNYGMGGATEVIIYA